LLGSSSITLTEGDTFSDSGATASDAEDGNLTTNIQITGTVDTSVLGTYSLFYNVSDSDGNAANQLTRTIIVEAAPVSNVNVEDLEKTLVTIAMTFSALFGFYSAMTTRFT